MIDHTVLEKPSTAPLIDIDPCLQLIAETSETSRRNRNVPAETIAALEKSGIFRAMVPADKGGLGATPQEWLRALIKLAENDMSTAWITGIISIHPFQIALMDNRAQQETFGRNPDVRISSSYNPFGARTEIVEGGIMLHGRWAWSSGSAHCDWVLLGTLIEGRELLQTCLVPRKDYEIEDTWHSMGLEGTGSNDIVITTPVFVPDYRIHSQLDGYHRLNNQSETKYSLPWAQIFAATVAAPAIGAVRHAIRLFTAHSRTSSTDPTKLQGDPDILRRVADAVTLANRAETELMQKFDTMMETLARGEEIPLLDRARYRYETGSIVVRMMEAIDLLFDVAGGRSVYLGAAIQNIWHDIHIARAHVANNPVPLARNFGNMVMGGENKDFFI